MRYSYLAYIASTLYGHIFQWSIFNSCYIDLTVIFITNIPVNSVAERIALEFNGIFVTI